MKVARENDFKMSSAGEYQGGESKGILHGKKVFCTVTEYSAQ